MSDEKIFKDCLKTLQPFNDTLDIISGKWRLQVIIAIGAGCNRFNIIQANIPKITPKVLSKELKILEANKIIRREISTGYPVKINYYLEPYADTLTPVINAIRDWGLNHRSKIIKAMKETGE